MSFDSAYYTFLIPGREPFYLRVLFEPGELALGVMPGVPLYKPCRRFERNLPGEVRRNLLVPQGAHGLQPGGVPGRNQPPCLLYKPFFEHALDPSVNVAVKPLPCLQ